MEPTEPVPYPQLAPELRALSGDALLLWGDAGERRRALEAILQAWESGSPDLRAAVERVDQAVAGGLAAVRLPRGPVRDIEIPQDVGWAGQKTPSSILRLSGRFLDQALRLDRRPEAIFKTWVHESLHARQSYAPDVATEYSLRRGYEEGMVEGLARVLTRDRAGIDPPGTSYNYYVAAYRSLAMAFEIQVFQTSRFQAAPDPAALVALWRTVLR